MTWVEYYGLILCKIFLDKVTSYLLLLENDKYLVKLIKTSVNCRGVSRISVKWVHDYEEMYLKYKFDHLTFRF